MTVLTADSMVGKAQVAEQVVQLGNIAEAIRAAAMGENSSDLMTEISELKTQLQSLQA